MGQAKHGDTVRVHYCGKLHDGSVFDTSFDREPLQFTIGAGQVILGFEEAVVGMNPGDSKTTEVPVEEGFGPYREDMVVKIDKSEFERLDQELAVGDRLPIPQPGGPPIEVTIANVTESEVTVDANHPLAGEELTVDIELIDIVQRAH
jgi:FKBP-type peptidyl-prolyl cis-trans isomerase 2